MEYVHQIITILKRWFSFISRSDRQNHEYIFYQLLLDKNYDEALKLAQQHGYLDIDMVYKCKWRHSGITILSINSVLGKVNDKLWAINECVQTVPISYEACKTLIEFGLREANLRLLYELGDDSLQQDSSSDDKHEGKLRRDRPKTKQPLLSSNTTDDHIEGLIDFNNLNDAQKELCRCRQSLKRHEHSLFAYASILGDYRNVQRHFDHVFYDEFRRKCPLNVCIEYANESDAHAVDILLNFYTDDLSPHLLAILSNFPETLSPYQYRNLLPCLKETDLVYQWRPISGQVKQESLDWSNRCASSSALSNSILAVAETYEKEFYEQNAHLKKYLTPLNADVLTEWFIERSLEMESRTLLLSNAMQLLHLGSELNIKDLQETNDDLEEFDRIIYDCCTENNIYLSFSEFKKMSHLDRLSLMTGDSVKNCKDRFRFFVIPYMHRREESLGFEGKVDLLRSYFHHLAYTKEHICKLIYSDLLDKIECDNFVADWTRELDDFLDEIGEDIKRIERERQAKQLSIMASQTMALGDFNESYEACRLIMRKDYRECWALCCQLGMHEQFNDLEAKYNLLAYTLAHCEDPDGRMSAKILNYIIELRKRDKKIQLAYLQHNM